MHAQWSTISGLAAAVLFTFPAGVVAAESVADAAERQDFAEVRALLEQQADASASQADGTCALHWAARHGDPDMAKLLITAGADVKAASRYGVTPLSLACLRGNSAVVHLLLDAGADPNTALPGGETVLMTAARTGRVEPVLELLARGADVNAREHKGQTALMWAAAEGNTEVVDALLKAGADFRTPLASGFTPFFFAVREGRTGAVLRLLKAGIDVNDTTHPERRNDSVRRRMTTPLLLAAENGHFELGVTLLEAGADPNARPSGFTALHAITWVRKPIRGDGDPPPAGTGNLDSLDFVRHLASHGADVNARLESGESGKGRFTTTGSTPFVLAARTSDLPLLKVLRDLGADARLGNADSCTPLLAAAGVGALGNGDETAGTEEEAIATVQWLLKQGADINAVDNNGETVMHGAAYQEWARLAHLLADQGADIRIWNRKNKCGWTPLMVAHGHRPGNFRPSPLTITALEKVMRAKGVDPPKVFSDVDRVDY
jgi:ankyrin repeat protein